MKLRGILVATCAFAVCFPAAILGQDSHSAQATGLTVEDIINLVGHGIPADQVIGLIQRNPSNFDLSLQTIDNLKRVGVPPTVIDTMLKARASVPLVQAHPPLPEPSGADPPPPSNVHPAPVNDGSGLPTNGQMNVGTGATPDSGSQVPINTATRLAQAKSAQVPPDSWAQPSKQSDPGCPLPAHGKVTRVDLDYDSGSSSISRLGRSGTYCFALKNANPLYDWSLALNVSEPTGSPFDLLNDAIQTLTKLSTGAASAKPTPIPGSVPTKSVCPDLSVVTVKAAALKQSLAAIVPQKDSGGKVVYVSLQNTRTAWHAVPGAFADFELAVKALVGNLPSIPDQSCDSVLQQAESIILDDYPKLRAQYQDLSA